MDNLTRAAINAIANVAAYEVTDYQEWLTCYNIRITGVGWRFVSKASVSSLVRSIKAYRQ